MVEPGWVSDISGSLSLAWMPVFSAVQAAYHTAPQVKKEPVGTSKEKHCLDNNCLDKVIPVPLSYNEQSNSRTKTNRCYGLVHQKRRYGIPVGREKLILFICNPG
jgi:hypothetical protein